MKPQVCDWDDIKHLLNNDDLGDAKFTPLKKRRIWFVTKDNQTSEIQGVASLIVLSKTSVRISSVYVPSIWRDKGIATDLIKSMLGYCAYEGFKKIDARAKRGNMYQRLGFLKMKTFKCGSGLYIRHLLNDS